ncbi:MAG: hypothetical protein OEZ06_20715 [Myxococcales bacterium]|nr:hypothetical protein [Myxococcales bacterium]
MGKGQIRVDGAIGEWGGAPFVRLGDSSDGSLRFALGFDTEALYFGASVRDDSFIRGARPSKREDAVVIALEMPRAKGKPLRTEVWLFAGSIGKSRAVAAVASGGGKPKPARSIEIVEGPLEKGEGYVLEARIPWKAVAGGREFLIGRGAVRLHDVDGRAGASPRVSASASGTRLPPLEVDGGPNWVLAEFLRSKGLGAPNVRSDLVADVTGDKRLERVVLAGSFAVVVGPDIQGGGGYHYMDLPVAAAADVREASLRDLTGDGKAELLLRMRQQNELGRREIFTVSDVGSPQAKRLFGVELRKEVKGGHVEAKLSLSAGRRAKGGARIEVRAGSSSGLEPGALNERPAQGLEPMILPWGKVMGRVYRWDGTRFALEKEEENPDYKPPTHATASTSSGSRESSVLRTASHAKPVGVDDLVAAFRKARGIPKGLEPRFVRHVNLAEDRRLESLMLFGDHLLVVGKGYRGGSGYFYYQLPVAAADHIQRVFTGDVTGDGRREIFVRYKQLIDDVQREILLVYTMGKDAADGGVQELLRVEVRRARGGDSIGNVVALVPDGRHWALRIKPGRAEGWSQGSYPFVAESLDGVQPLLLPWQHRATRYAYRGGRLSVRH